MDLIYKQVIYQDDKINQEVKFTVISKGYSLIFYAIQQYFNCAKETAETQLIKLAKEEIAIQTLM